MKRIIEEESDDMRTISSNVTKLSKIIDTLTSIYDTEGDFDIHVVRNGNFYHNVEIYCDGYDLYIELYKRGE